MKDTVFQIFGAMGGVSLIGVVVKAVLDRKKLSAEATKIIADAAATVVEGFSGDNADLRTRVRDLEQDRAALHTIMRQSAAWSRKAYAELVHLGSKIEEPPEYVEF